MKYDVVIIYGEYVEAESKEQAIEIAASHLELLNVGDISDLADCSEVDE